MFKSWQIFVFSLVPLALVFAGVIIGSMRGLDAEREVFPTAVPRPENGAEGPAPTAPAGAAVIELVAENILFDQSSLSASAGQSVQINFDNRDAGVLHNFSLYTDQSATQAIFQGDLTTGPVVTTYEFTAPSTSGSYFFRCDVHPDTMTGTFTIN